MMHEPEKSDSVVVAVKPTNKAERSVECQSALNSFQVTASKSFHLARRRRS
jgi:hypothetical protein